MVLGQKVGGQLGPLHSGFWPRFSFSPLVHKEWSLWTEGRVPWVQAKAYSGEKTKLCKSRGRVCLAYFRILAQHVAERGHCHATAKGSSGQVLVASTRKAPRTTRPSLFSAQVPHSRHILWHRPRQTLEPTSALAHAPVHPPAAAPPSSPHRNPRSHLLHFPASPLNIWAAPEIWLQAPSRGSCWREEETPGSC